MKHLIIVALLTMVLGCQDFDNGTLVEPETLDSNVTTESTNEEDHEVILSSLERAGHPLTSDQLNFLIRLIDATTPLVQSLDHQMPASLRDANGRWNEIINRDPEAAAFALKLRSAIEDKLTTPIPDNVQELSCSNWNDLMFSIFMCLKIETIICKWDPSCSPGPVRVIECIYETCNLD